MNYVLLLHVAIAFFSFRSLGTLVTRDDRVLLVFSLSYAFSGAVLARLGQTVILFALAWLPLLYSCSLKIALFRDLKIKNIAFFAAVATILVFTGTTYYVVFAAMVLGIFFLSGLWERTIDMITSLCIFTAIGIAGLLSAIKWIPTLLVSGSIVRIDPIDPLSGGGLLEMNLSSFIFGTTINSRYILHESIVLVGAVLCIFAIIGLAVGRRSIAIPGFFTLLFAFVWADGGNTLLSFIHFLSGLESLRCPGRIFAAVVPIALLLAMEGYAKASAAFRQFGALVLDVPAKRRVLLGVAIVLLVKLLELPFQVVPPAEAILSIILVGGFLALLLLGRATERNCILFLAGALFLEAVVLAKNFPILQPLNIGKILLMATILVLFLYIADHQGNKALMKNPLCIFLVTGFLVTLWGCTGFLADSDPHLWDSPGKAVASAIAEMSEEQGQVWVFDTGWPFQHIDFTYWYIQHGIHPVRAYYAYFMKNTPGVAYSIGNTTYATVDWIVDTAALEGSPVKMPGIPVVVAGVPLYRMEHVLPNAFVLRGGSLVEGHIEEFSPDRVVLRGAFREGDTAILKSAFYPGWKVNGKDAQPAGNMVAGILVEDAERVEFTFEPLDYRVGQACTLAGLLALLALFLKREAIERYLSSPPPRPAGKKKASAAEKP